MRHIGIDTPSPDDTNAGEGDQSSPTDWGEIFGQLVFYTSISINDIPYLTMPQIDAYRESIGKNIHINSSVSNIFGGLSMQSPAPPDNDGKPPKVSQFADIANIFSGFNIAQ